MLNLDLLSEKLKKCRNQLCITIEELSKGTGIPIKNLEAYENGIKQPDGDEILILSHYYKCDYKFFLSNEKDTLLDKTEILYRKFGEEFSKEDRQAVQDILFLAECESFIDEHIHSKFNRFHFEKKGNHYKTHGIECARALRKHFKYKPHQIVLDVYKDFRSLGIKIFRRRLSNSKISGLCIKHPQIGSCVLVNYDEDIYRQRFTVAHEVGHAILDDEDVIVSLKKEKNPREVRANSFASNFLAPKEFLEKIPDPYIWDSQKIVKWANKVNLSTESLGNVLQNNHFINEATNNILKKSKVKKDDKIDPELSKNLSPKERLRKKELLEQGLSSDYVGKCLDAYHNGIISAARMSEMLLIEHSTTDSVVKLYNRSLNYGY